MWIEWRDGDAGFGACAVSINASALDVEGLGPRAWVAAGVVATRPGEVGDRVHLEFFGSCPVAPIEAVTGMREGNSDGPSRSDPRGSTSRRGPRRLHRARGRPAPAPVPGRVTAGGGGTGARGLPGEAILEAAPDAIVAIDGRGPVAGWGPPAARDFGFAREEALGRPIAERIIPEAGREAHRRGLKNHPATGAATVPGHRLEVTALRKDGGEFPAGSSISSARPGADGAPRLRDLAERRGMEEVLPLSEEQFRGAFEAAAIGMAVVSTEGRWLRANPALCRIVGYTEAELLATTFRAITHPDDQEGDLELRRRMLDGQVDSYQKEKRYLHKTGEVVWIRLSVSLVRDAGGRPMHFVSLIEDITLRKRAEGRAGALLARMEDAYDATIEGWSRALELRDHETEGHSRRVTEMTLRLARALGTPEGDLVHIRRGALLHDIGKMGIPDAVLRKPGPLDEAEWAVMKQHPRLALELLSPIPFLGPALEIPYCHHEKWDGSGYPRGLRGEQIPPAARMFAAVDIWDALLSDRPYREGWAAEAVREHIRSLSGSHLDPRVVEAFLPMIGEPARPVPAALGHPAGGPEAAGDEADTELLGSAFGAMLEHTDDLVVLLDGSWRIRAASRSFLAAFAPGLPPRGLDFVGLLDAGSRDKCRTLLGRPPDRSLTLELNHRTPSRAPRLVSYSVCGLSRPVGGRLLTAVGPGREGSLELVEKLVHLNQELEVSRRELAEQALSDPLTGLGNRRWLFDRMETLWAEGRRRGRLTWVMMADLDHFKAINDTYGHRAGDEVLIAAARAMRQSVRAEDLVARYGGEEFVLAGLCDHGFDPEGLAARVLEAIRDLRVECPGGPLRVTTSLGVVLAGPGTSGPPWFVLQAADRALYRAKAGGRDRFEAEPGILGRCTAPPEGGGVSGRIGLCHRGRAS